MFGNLSNYLLIAERVFGILGAVVYFIFALVVVKQVSTMSKNVKDKFNGILIAFSYLHLLLAIILIFMAATVL